MGNFLAFLGAAGPALAISFFLSLLAGVGLYSMTRSGIAGLLAFVVAFMVVFGAGYAISAYNPVDVRTVEVITRWGRLTGEVFEPGLHWKAAFIERTVVIPTAIRSYETGDAPNESRADFTDIPVTAQTIDGQQIVIKYTVIFRIDAENVVSVVDNIGDINEVVENIVKAQSRSQSRVLAQNYTADALYSGDGIVGYRDTVYQALEDGFAPYGITMVDFLIRKIDFAQEYIDAIEAQQIAEENIETQLYNAMAAENERDRLNTLAEADARRAVLLAQSEAERTRLTAQANADQQRLMADAEAYSIETRGGALRAYPEMLQLEFILTLDHVNWGIMPDTGITPLLQLPTQ